MAQRHRGAIRACDGRDPSARSTQRDILLLGIGRELDVLFAGRELLDPGNAGHREHPFCRGRPYVDVPRFRPGRGAILGRHDRRDHSERDRRDRFLGTDERKLRLPGPGPSRILREPHRRVDHLGRIEQDLDGLVHPSGIVRPDRGRADGLRPLRRGRRRRGRGRVCCGPPDHESSAERITPSDGASRLGRGGTQCDDSSGLERSVDPAGFARGLWTWTACSQGSVTGRVRSPVKGGVQ